MEYDEVVSNTSKADIETELIAYCSECGHEKEISYNERNADIGDYLTN